MLALAGPDFFVQSHDLMIPSESVDLAPFRVTELNGKLIF